MVPKKPGPKQLKKDIIEKPITKIKKKKKRQYQTFALYLYKILKMVTKDGYGISRKSMLIMDAFVNDMLEQIASEASRLVAHSKRNTLGSREIQSAIKLLMPGELWKHANIDATKAIQNYYNSTQKE